MFTAFRQEMGEGKYGRDLKPNGHIYALEKTIVTSYVWGAQLKADPCAFPIHIGDIVAVSVTPDFYELLALNNGDAYWVYIGKHKGDLGEAKVLASEN